MGHGLFLLASMLLTVFVRVPAPARIFLLVAVVTNAVLDIRVRVALTFTALAAMTTMAALCKWQRACTLHRQMCARVNGSGPISLFCSELAHPEHQADPLPVCTNLHFPLLTASLLPSSKRLIHSQLHPP